MLLSYKNQSCHHSYLTRLYIVLYCVCLYSPILCVMPIQSYSMCYAYIVLYYALCLYNPILCVMPIMCYAYIVLYYKCLAYSTRDMQIASR